MTSLRVTVHFVNPRKLCWSRCVMDSSSTVNHDYFETVHSQFWSNGLGLYCLVSIWLSKYKRKRTSCLCKTLSHEQRITAKVGEDLKYAELCLPWQWPRWQQQCFLSTWGNTFLRVDKNHTVTLNEVKINFLTLNKMQIVLLLFVLPFHRKDNT